MLQITVAGCGNSHCVVAPLVLKITATAYKGILQKEMALGA